MKAIEALERTTKASIALQGGDATVTMETLLKLIQDAKDIEAKSETTHSEQSWVHRVRTEVDERQR